ncbi:hypothetical protein E0500_042880 [Streptomyces sp. KM273126]|uniref:protealysin inhibitor emfourin n=1 Tax=Streptomyces sp. KM273126 TaxID=2545247 RepID=UPI001040867A|nr:protealysin inhibitor emfourin [Streptomyces sp. KM273126]MBA2813877.1 hypothetical protein [Streptomyces sp. KM273126]
MVRVSLERSGGYTGLRTTSYLDTEQLPAEQAAEVQHALEVLRSAPPVTAGRAKSAVPRYRLTIHWPSGDQAVEVTEPDVSPVIRPLLTELARRGLGK